MSVVINQCTYKHFGNCLKIENDLCELYVTLDIGPRVIRFALKDCENMFFEDPCDQPGQSGELMDRVFYPGAQWYAYGGHRLWISPESLPETYYPDNDPVIWEIDGNTVTLIPKPQIHNQLQHSMRLTLAEDSTKVSLEHRITNTGVITQRCAPWDITVMAPGGLEIVPQPSTDTGLLGNRVLALWPYTNMTDPRIFWGEKYISLQQDPTAKTAFKFGINNEHGWAVYFNHGCAFIKRYTLLSDAVYPDFGVSYETYTNSAMLEMETLGRLADVFPGESLVHWENWELKSASVVPNPKVENEIDACIQALRLIEK